MAGKSASLSLIQAPSTGFGLSTLYKFELKARKIDVSRYRARRFRTITSPLKDPAQVSKTFKDD